MTSETDTPEPGTDSAPPQAPDTVNDWDYDDPDEGQDTVAAAEPEATDDGTATAEEAEATEEAPESAAIEASVEAVVTLADGTKTTVAELVKGHLRQDDYSRKTQDLSNQRKALEADVARMDGVIQALADHLEKLVPPAPDHSMALRDAAGYTRAMALHQGAMAQLNSLIELGQQPKAIKEAMSKEDHAALVRDENAKLLDRFPDIANPQKKEAFFKEAVEAAAGMGFSMEELQGVTDHRLFAAMHYAAKGLKAEQALKAAQAKVVKAPPVAPQKPAGTGRVVGNAAALKRFADRPTARNAAAAWDGES